MIFFLITYSCYLRGSFQMYRCEKISFRRPTRCKRHTRKYENVFLIKLRNHASIKSDTDARDHLYVSLKVCRAIFNFHFPQFLCWNCLGTHTLSNSLRVVTVAPFNDAASCTFFFFDLKVKTLCIYKSIVFPCGVSHFEGTRLSDRLSGRALTYSVYRTGVCRKKNYGTCCL